jgi:hypothetical protein
MRMSEQGNPAWKPKDLLDFSGSVTPQQEVIARGVFGAPEREAAGSDPVVA